MSTDAKNAYADGEELLATTNSGSTTTLISDIIDHGTGGAGLAHGMFFEIIQTVLAVGPTSTQVYTLEQDNDVTFQSAVTLGTYTSSTALTPAGEYVAQVAMPTVTERYTRVTGAWSTAATAGTVTIRLTDSPQATWTGA